jgi:DNA-binding NarL/FixJ family response regulator
MIRVLLVDDQAIIRQGLRPLLESQPDLAVVGGAISGLDAIAQVQLVQPDVVLMDIRMPGMDGVAATRAICQLPNPPQILVLTTFDDEAYVQQAMQFGAKGYLLKDTPPDEIAIAIRAVHRGYTHLSPGLFEKNFGARSNPAPLPPQLAELTPREQQVLRLIADGSSNREIAIALSITEKTVKNHVTRILSGLGLRDRTQAAIFVNSLLDIWQPPDL